MTLDEAKKIIFEKKPEFARLYRDYGDKTWADYATDNYKVAGLPNTGRTDEFFKVMQSILSPLIGEEKSLRTVETLRENSLVSTADHHGVLCHPFFSNSTLVRSFCIPNSLRTNDYTLSTISLTCGCISPSNSSYPRGIFFHDNNLKEIKMLFLSLHDRRRSLYGIKALKKISFERQRDKVTNMDLKDSEKHKLVRFMDTILSNEKIFSEKLLSSQYTIINDILWNELFGEQHGNLVYLEIETLVRELLLTYHIDHETDVHNILFDDKVRAGYITNFEGIVGAHTTSTHKGSHLFWYIDPDENARKQLFIHGNTLRSIDGKIQIKITSEVIKENLLNHRLLPSMAFCYSLISFYYGLTLGGGFSQVQYLGDMKVAFGKTLETIHDTRTNIFTGEFVLTTIGQGGSLQGATLIDTLLYNKPEEKKIMQEIKNKKISETLDMMMPEFIEIVTGKKEDLQPEILSKATYSV